MNFNTYKYSYIDYTLMDHNFIYASGPDSIDVYYMDYDILNLVYEEFTFPLE